MNTRGVTLVEMIVALAILGVVMGLTAVAVRPVAALDADSVAVRLSDAHEVAVRTGVPVVLAVGGQTVRFLPDGSSSGGMLRVGDAAYLMDPLTSEVRRVEQ